MQTSPASIRFGLVPLIARLLLTAEFLIAVNGKINGWSDQAGYMAAKGMTHIAPLLGAALAIEAVGSLCVILGYRARAAATLLFVYLGIVTVRLHDFWHQTGPAAGGNMTHFFKNVGMMGGLLMVAAYGAGEWSVDARRERARSELTG
jgi:putative oxidoreductase